MHLCHAHGCKAQVPPKRFACKTHWYMLPKFLRDAIWREYRPGQEEDKAASCRYYAVQRLAVARLAEKTGAPSHVVGGYIVRAYDWRYRAVREGQGDPLLGLVPDWLLPNVVAQ